MVDGIIVFKSNVDLEHKQKLEDKFEFGTFIDIENGNEIPIPSRKQDEKKAYPKMVWRKAIHNHLEIRLGWKINPITNEEQWNLKVIGSIHKYFKGGDNSGLFTTLDAIQAIDQMCTDLFLTKERAKVTSLEIGLNIPFSCSQEWLDLNLVKRYKGKLFAQIKEGFAVELSHYAVKLYEKNREELRYEVHYSDIQELREKFGLNLLSDLTAEKINEVARGILLEKCFAEINFIDGIDLTKEKDRKDGMKAAELKLITQFSHDIYLKQLIRDKKNPELINNSLNQQDGRRAERFRKLVKKYGADGSTEYLRSFIENFIAESEQEVGNGKCHFFATGIKSKKVTHLKKGKGNKIEKLNLNTLIKMTNVKKNKKQIAKEKRDQYHSLYVSFMDRLKDKIEELEENKKLINIRQYNIAA